DVLLVSAAIASLAGIAFGLVKAAREAGPLEGTLTGFAVLRVVLSWLLVQVVFMLRYARLFYGEDGGVDFNEQKDPDYRDFAYLAERDEPGSTIPNVPYTDVENEVWATVSRELSAKHERLACRTYRDAAERMQLPRDRVPQLQEVNERLAELTGFRVRPVAGL